METVVYPNEDANVIPTVQIESVQINLTNYKKSFNKSVSLTWQHLSVSTLNSKGLLQYLKLKKENKNVKNIISDVEGIARPKEILAILGASGAGKTAFLNALNFRSQKHLKVEGEIKLNGSLISSIDEISAISCYVQQDDLFIGHLTVKEHLTFQAMLRMDKSKTKVDRLNRIKEVIFELNLEKCQDTLIGIFGRKGISGGEKRRLAFASEIITNPGLLFCDEPTSGLDSFMALSVVECMRDLAKKGKTIICTVHQPSSEIFEMFDRICLMSEGRIAFIGDALEANRFFQSIGYWCPPNYNLAEFFIKKLAILSNEKEKCLENVKKICDNFENSEYKRTIKEEINSMNSKFKTSSDDSTKLKINKPLLPNVFVQMRWLLWRNFLGLYREPFCFKIQIAQTFIVSIMFGLIFLQLKYNQQGVQNMNGLLFLCICNAGFSTLFFVVNTFPLELPSFLREYNCRMYSLFSYYISRMIADSPNFLILPLIFMTIVYWMTNLNRDLDRFFMCLIIINLVVQSSFAFGTFISAVSPSTNIALALSGPLLVPLMIFSGFLLNFDSIPNYFVWLRYLSLFSYAFETIMVNQWKGVKNLECESNSTFCFNNGDEILSVLKVNKDNFNLDIGLLVVLILFYRFLSFIALWLRAKSK